MDEENATIQALPATTVRLIGSTQVITSVVSVVKELIENSLDAGATTLDIKLESYGFDKIELRDNGCGIKQSNTVSMGLPHHTSKITNTADLAALTTYGFRGEALASLCAVSRVNITTKTSEDDVGMTYDLGPDGAITDKKPSHLGQGTTVVASQLFHNIPVRRQYYSAAKRRKEELKKVEDLVIAYSVIKYDVRFTLRHNRDIVWQKTGMSSIRHSLLKVFGSSALSLMIHKCIDNDDPKCELELYIPRPDTDCHVMSRTSSDRCFIFINHRPVTHKDITKVLKQSYCDAAGCETARWPLACLSVQVPPSAVDVNLEPNKTRVLMEQNSDVLTVLARMLEEVYGKKNESVKEPDNDLVQTNGPHRDGQGQPEGHNELDQSKNHGEDGQQGEDLHGQNPQYPSSHASRDQHQQIQVQLGQNTDRHSNGKAAAQVAEDDRRDKSYGNVTMEESEIKNCTADLTLPLTKPLHNSTRCDVTFNQISTQNVTFDLLKEFEDADDSDLFGDLTDDSFATKGLDITTPPGVPKPHQGSTENEGSLGNTVDVDKGNTTEMGHTLPCIDTDMLAVGDVSAAGSTVVRSTSIQNTESVGSDSTSMETSDRQAKDWTRGDAVSDSTGKKVQPVQLLLPGASSVSLSSSPSVSIQRRPPEDFSTPAAKMKQAANSPGQMTLLDVTNSSNIKKPSTAFIFFSKEVRATVVAENPGANFQTVAKLIGARWNALTTEQRDKYEKMMTKDVERYREEVSSRKEKGQSTSLLHSNKRRKLDEHNRCVKSMLSSPAIPRRQKKTKPTPRTTVTVEFSMCKLKNTLSSSPKPSSADGTLRLVGEVRPDGWWVGTDQEALVGITPWRLQETQIYTQLMENHSIPTEKLDPPLPLSPSALGSEDMWAVLVSLPSMPSYQSDSYCYLTDPRLSRSGFSIRKTQEQPPRVDIVSMVSCINGFGVKDLCEILRSIHQKPTVSVTDSRPTKVKYFLQGEAVRMARQMPHRVTAEEVQDLLRQMQKKLSAGHSGKCFHQRPFVHTFYNMVDIPLTQFCTQTDDDT